MLMPIRRTCSSSADDVDDDRVAVDDRRDRADVAWDRCGAAAGSSEPDDDGTDGEGYDHRTTPATSTFRCRPSRVESSIAVVLATGVTPRRIGRCSTQACRFATTLTVGACRPSEAFDDRAGAEAAAAAHRDQRVAAAGCVPARAAALVISIAPVPPSGCPRAIAPPFGFVLLEVGADLLGPRQHDRGERLVDLEHVDVVDRRGRCARAGAGWRRSGR